MATYKKRGYKPKTKVEKQEAIEDGSATAEVFNTLDETASKTEAWAEKNQKAILTVVGAIAVVIVGFILVQKFWLEPKNTEAANEMYLSQSYYERAVNAVATEKDSLFNLALNGTAGKYGFLDIVDNYGSTAAGNQARYYAGMAYLSMNNYQEAINYLDAYSANDEMTGPLAKGAIGDAFVQLDQQEEALKYYVEAATMQNNEITTPRFLLKAGVIAMNLGKSADALSYFSRITEEFKDSGEFARAEVYKGQAEAMN